MLSKRISLFALILVLVIMPAPPRLWAQDSAIGTIRGTVLDASGGRIAQASIVVVNTATGRATTRARPPIFTFGSQMETMSRGREESCRFCWSQG
ncbi:MAG TPA: carboxypeptidase-like regulatory domain-containing protein [Candidatus Sulfotelmatobacter sp.]|jgi:hypothetical protein|nr:carboxypeptidase-like regulatory domain-containing protein [Candidatus Sulfotelmatobacter sp.]